MRQRVAGALVVAAVGLGACGSSAVSESQLRSQATKICRDTERRTAAIPSPLGGSNPTQFLQRGLAVLQPELAHLRALHAPPSSEPRLRAALQDFASELSALRGAYDELTRGGDLVKIYGSLSKRARPLEANASREWKALGIPACASATH